MKAKAIATVYRFLWLTHLVRLFELKTCSEFNLNSLIYWNFDLGVRTPELDVRTPEIDVRTPEIDVRTPEFDWFPPEFILPPN